MSAVVRQQLRITGVVQGVGFRPFVHTLATDLGLGGTVRNQGTSVHIELEGNPAAVERFRRLLATEAPPASRIDEVETTVEVVAAMDDHQGRRTFAIAPSTDAPDRVGTLPPDAAPCDGCLAELADPDDRRYGHPFISCTQCGPRFTIARSTPYDRATTTMAPFAMCRECRAEYENPRDRRYHAQPISCWSCGPRLTYSARGECRRDTEAVETAIDRLRRGEILAVKGVGGYHLAVDASNGDAIRALRARKDRPDKPFAVMVADLDEAWHIAMLSEGEASVLCGPDRPIVLAQRRPGSVVADGVAPRSPLVGVMLPSSPLHHLLFTDQGPNALVMTSANLSGEPICHRDEDAFDRLRHIADGFLHHDREIRHPCDDSVVRLVGDVLIPIRRSRGVVPLAVRLPFDVPPLVAAGGDLKNVFAYAQGREVWLSQHIGDLGTVEAQQALDSASSLVSGLARIEPRLAATDAHPRYHSRRWGRAVAATRSAMALDVHHHHAHAAALMVDNGLSEAAELLTFVFDGTGLGPDGSLWGGEALIARYRDHERVAHLLPLPLPGGDAAVHNPCRVALAHLAAAGVGWDPSLPPVRACSDLEKAAVTRQLPTAPTTSSMGRLFDSVASVLDVRHRVTYEAQAAIELEHLARTGDPDVPLRFGFDGDVVDPRPVIAGVADAISRGAAASDIAASFHAAVVDAIVAIVMAQAPSSGQVGLTGGVFQNALLLGRVIEALRIQGFTAVVHEQVPPNDAGLALGQVAVAGALARRRGGAG